MKLFTLGRYRILIVKNKGEKSKATETFLNELKDMGYIPNVILTGVVPTLVSRIQLYYIILIYAGLNRRISDKFTGLACPFHPFNMW
jgi:hypothetical protein